MSPVSTEGALSGFFQLQQHNTNVRTELMAGLTTCLGSCMALDLGYVWPLHFADRKNVVIASEQTCSRRLPRWDRLS
jgi:hypothetical protein